MQDYFQTTYSDAILPPMSRALQHYIMTKVSEADRSCGTILKSVKEDQHIVEAVGFLPCRVRQLIYKARSGGVTRILRSHYEELVQMTAGSLFAEETEESDVGFTLFENFD